MKTSDGLNWTRKKGGDYYRQPTWEMNLPAGWACPGAKDCLTKASRETGKLELVGPGFKCYAAVAERFPSARESRWENFDTVREMVKGKRKGHFVVPRPATHGSGDFFNQNYFDWWLETARQHPQVNFWAFTKSINYWVERLDDIPENLVMTASYGSKHEHLIETHGLRSARVFDDIDDVPADMVIDTDDWCAQQAGPSFALVENFSRTSAEAIAEHNARAQQH